MLSYQSSYQSLVIRGVAQPGSALRSGRRSREFESLHPDQSSLAAQQERRLPRRSETKAGGFINIFSYFSASYDSARQFNKKNNMKRQFYYVYILKSKNFHDCYYTGFTENIETRLLHHNSGGDSHTRKYHPWKIKTAIAFTDREQAVSFERYLKTSSGRAFAKKRL